MGKSTSGEVFLIENAILSYPHLFVPKRFSKNGVEQGEPFYSAALLVDAKTAERINGEAQKVVARHYDPAVYSHPSFGWPCTPVSMIPKYASIPRLAGLYCVNAKAGESFRPHVVDERLQDIIDRGQIYAGCVVAAGINAYTRPQPARPGEVGEGIGIGLNSIMKMADGEPLGGGATDAKALFQGVQAQSPASPATPMPGGAPAFGSAPAPQGPEAFGMPMPPFMGNN